MADDIRLETNFEHYISYKLEDLSESGWQVSKDDTGFDPSTALYLDDFISYVTAVSPEKIEKMKKNSGNVWKSNLEKALVHSLEIDGTVQTLRNGFVMAGYQTIDCSGHYPDDTRIPNIQQIFRHFRLVYR